MKVEIIIRTVLDEKSIDDKDLMDIFKNCRINNNFYVKIGEEEHWFSLIEKDNKFQILGTYKSFNKIFNITTDDFLRIIKRLGIKISNGGSTFDSLEDVLKYIKYIRENNIYNLNEKVDKYCNGGFCMFSEGCVEDCPLYEFKILKKSIK